MLNTWIIVIFSYFIAVVELRHCFQCTYNAWEPDRVEACLDPFDVTAESVGVSRVSCDGACLKSRFSRNQSITIVSRTCVTHTSTIESCIHGCFQSRDYRETCVWCCDTDYCNCAGSVTWGHLLSACALAAFVKRLLV